MRCAADTRTLARVCAALSGRIENARRTKQEHADGTARHDAQVRLDAYACALDDVLRIVNDELRDPTPPFGE